MTFASDSAACSYHTIGGPDFFSRLPDEVLQYVLEYLPTGDVLRLRQSSRTCANTPLSQSFWRSRFFPGHEFESIFETRYHAALLKGRFDSLYHLVRSIQGSPSFVNRERVWKLACSLWGIMNQVTSTSLLGNMDQLETLRWVDAHTALKPVEKFFSGGSRALYRRTLATPDDPVRVFVSFVEIFGRCYVSALRFEAADRRFHLLGYRHTASEVLAFVADAPGIAGFHLAQDERGFRGLAVLSTSGALSEWVGDPSGVPLRKLAFDPVTAARNTVQYLKCGFDVSTPFIRGHGTFADSSLPPCAGLEDGLVVHL